MSLGDSPCPNRKTQATAFGSWLASILKTHKIRIIDLSDKSGFHSNVIQNWLKGRGLPNGYSVVIIATALSGMLDRPRPDILEEIAIHLLKS